MSLNNYESSISIANKFKVKYRLSDKFKHNVTQIKWDLEKQVLNETQFFKTKRSQFKQSQNQLLQ